MNFITKFSKVLVKIIPLIFSDVIKGKEINGTKKTLYYERLQHLTFLFGKKINYEEEPQRVIKGFIKPGDRVFDIGANIGQYTLPISEILGDKGQLFSFEPDFKNFSFLQFNVNINKCINVVCLNFGVGESDSVESYYRDT